MPLELFEELCTLSKIEKPEFDLLDEHWGQIKGGKKGRMETFKRGFRYKK